MKSFNNLVQSAVNARTEGHDNPVSGVVAKTTNLPLNKSCGYQVMDRSRHSKTEKVSDEKTHGTINNKMFKRLCFFKQSTV